MKCDFAKSGRSRQLGAAFPCQGARDVEHRSNRLPTAAEIAEINATHLIDTPLKPADLLFLFGTREDVAERVEEAFRLWREGFFRWAIVSGGVTPGSDVSECEIINGCDGRARRCRRENILEEHRAMNTGENVIFSLPDHRRRAWARTISAA